MEVEHYLDFYYDDLEHLNKSCPGELFLDQRTAKAFAKAVMSFVVSFIKMEDTEAEAYKARRFKENLDNGVDASKLDPSDDEVQMFLNENRIEIGMKAAKSMFGKDKRRTLTNTANSILEAKNVWRAEPHYTEVSKNETRAYYDVIFDNQVKHIDHEKDYDAFESLVVGNLPAAKEKIGIPKEYKYITPDEYAFARQWISIIEGKRDELNIKPGTGFGMYASFPESQYNALTGITKVSLENASLGKTLSDERQVSVVEVRHRTKRSSEIDHVVQVPIIEGLMTAPDITEEEIIAAMVPKIRELWRQRGTTLKVILYINNQIVQYNAAKSIRIYLNDFMELCGLKDRVTAREALITAGDALTIGTVFEDKGRRINTRFVQRSEWINGRGKRSGYLDLTLSDDAWNRYAEAKKQQKGLVQYPDWIYKLSTLYPGAINLAIEYYDRCRISVTKDNKGTWRKMRMELVLLYMGYEYKERKRAKQDCVTPFWNNLEYLEKNSPMKFSLLYPTGEKITEEDKPRAMDDYDFLSSLMLHLEENIDAEPDYTDIIVKAEEYKEQQESKRKKKRAAKK